MKNMYEENQDYTPSDFELKINNLIENELDYKIGMLKTELNQKNKMFDDLNQENVLLKKENNKLTNKHNQIEAFETFQLLVDENNLGEFLPHFKLKEVTGDCDINNERIPKWFKWLVTYYQDKDKLFTLMDLFNIKYPSEAKSIKMPYCFNQEELDVIFHNLHKMYVCNGCIFGANIVFWYGELCLHEFDFYKLMKKSSYAEIPWQLFLRNELLLTDKYFDKILNALEKKQPHSSYFFRLPEYQILNEDQFNQMAKFLPDDKLYDDHKKFIEFDKSIIKRNSSLAFRYKNKINNNQFSTFYYINYPIDMQIEFIKKHTIGYDSKFNLVKKMDISIKEKLKIIQDIAKEELKS